MKSILEDLAIKSSLLLKKQAYQDKLKFFAIMVRKESPIRMKKTNKNKEKGSDHEPQSGQNTAVKGNTAKN